MARILIVDDEALLRRTLAILLLEQRYEVMEAGSGEEALDRLERDFHADLMLLDLSLPGIGGLETLRRLREWDQRTAVILMTAFGTIPSAVEAMRLGAFDYLSKPFRNDEMLLGVRRALEMQQLSSEVQDLRSELEAVYGFNEIVGVSPQIREVFRLMAKLAPVNATVLITGESGTGKELVARAIHEKSQRSENAFITLNCAAVPAELIESELFGHEKGAFTGAAAKHLGKFEQAEGGTLFLDEIGDMPVSMQAKLLRVLEEGEVERVGGDKPIKVNVRVIVATHRNLEDLVKKNEFRADLFHRVFVFPLTLPPLRERNEDFPALVAHFTRQVAKQNGWKEKIFSDDAIGELRRYTWPGNVRELRNIVERIVLLSPEDAVTDDDVRQALPTGELSVSGGFTTGATTRRGTLEQRTAAFEREVLVTEIRRHNFHMTNVARALGLERSHFYKKCQQLGIDLHSLRNPE